MPLQQRQRQIREERERCQLDMSPKRGAARENSQAFIPLADLLKRSHKDRVQYHLQKLDTEEESVATDRGNNRFRSEIKDAQG